jgi:hypothetical protein
MLGKKIARHAPKMSGIKKTVHYKPSALVAFKEFKQNEKNQISGNKLIFKTCLVTAISLWAIAAWTDYNMEPFRPYRKH